MLLILVSFPAVSFAADSWSDCCAVGDNAPEQPGQRRSREEMRKELEEFKMKFIAQEISLQPDQQKRFVDLYQQMQEEKMRVFSAAMRLDRKVRHDKNASDADFEQAARAMSEAKEKDAEIDKRYDKDFATFLTSKQIYLMKSAEDKFRRKMHEMRQKKQKKADD